MPGRGYDRRAPARRHDAHRRLRQTVLAACGEGDALRSNMAVLRRFANTSRSMPSRSDAVGRVEPIVLFDANPGQFRTLASQFIAAMGVFLSRFQQFEPRGQPCASACLVYRHYSFP